MTRSSRVLTCLVAAAFALAGCNALLGIKEGDPLDDAGADSGDTGASFDGAVEVDVDTGATIDTGIIDTGIIDTGAAVDTGAPIDTGAVDASVADTADSGDGAVVDTSVPLDADAGCSELAAYPAAKGCPDFNWACWPVPSDGPLGSNYTVKTICGDNVVLDKTTGLMWAQAEEPGTFTQANAKTRCTSSRRAGFSDWRLPTRIELTSLVDRSRATSPTLDPTAFPGASIGPFWSSTVYALSTNNAWYVSFGHGYTYYTAWSVAYGARCVR